MNEIKKEKETINEMLMRRARNMSTYLENMLKWCFLALFTGGICGTIGVAFHYIVAFVTSFRGENPWTLYCLPVAGLLIVLLYRGAKMADDGGTNTIINSVRSADKIPIAMAPLIFIGTMLTHLCGGSSGREGAALQLGGSIAAFLGRIIKLKDEDIRVITMCGMSAVFSALFGTPLTAAVFSMEVVHVGIMHYSSFLPCIVSSLTSSVIAGALGVEKEAMAAPVISQLGLHHMGQVIIIALICALVSVLFVETMHFAGHTYKKFFKNQYIRIVVGACLVIGLTLLLGTYDYNGAGMPVIERALHEPARPEAFILKIIMTALTLGAGFKGGEIVPSFFIGATLGNVVATLIGFDMGLGAAVGMICFFCAVVNCPIASILLSVEFFGGGNVAIFGLACAVSYLISGYGSLYSSQRIMYSKIAPRLRE
ncbi:MAG: chloride channel protein [Lachnospiraceae bacterium]|nr:chloride channel protein [Lachnospiraceae bacterium]